MLNEQVGGAHLNNRRCDSYKLLFNDTAIFAGSNVPHILSAVTYPVVGTTQRGAAPQQLATGLWWYRPSQDIKVLALTFLSNTGANDAAGIWEIGLYPRINPTQAVLGKRHKATLTLGTLTHTSQSVEPFTGSSVGSNKTLRHADTIAWAYRDTGDLQVYDKGYDAANGTGTIYVDMTAWDSIAIALLQLPTSSIQEVVGIAEECS